MRERPRQSGLLRRLALTLAVIVAAPVAASAQDKVVIATTGGAYEEALRKAWFEPFTKATGIEVVAVAATGGVMRAQTRAMAQSGNVTWDIYFEGEIQASSAEHMEVATDLTSFCAEYAGRPDLAANTCIKGGVIIAAGATLMAYDKAALQGREPKSWADMWDARTFPGGRAFPNFGDPWRVLAAALLADGVTKDALFPLDLDRAFAKMEEIRPQVSLWWKTGDQSVQGFRNGDYSIGQIWLTRANALKTEGRDVGWSYDAAFLVGDRATLLKGAPNEANARRMLEFWLKTPETQARLCEAMLCTPPSRDAIALMSAAAQAAMPTADQVEKTVVVPDADWINAHRDEMIERWNAWIAG